MELAALTVQVRKLKLRNRVVSTPTREGVVHDHLPTDEALADRIQ